MNMRPEPTIRKFNPGTFQSDEEVIRQFVARKRELDIVLEVLRGNIEAPSCQHTLIVAPRGRGKTMLLARVAAELRTNDLFSNRLLPVRFMEESQEIMTAGDFWLEALFHLASETAKSDPVFSHELRAARDDLASRWHGNELDLRARATVLDAADRLRRRLVLMVENMQALCADVDEDFGWKLREALQTQPEITLLATATSRFKELDDPAQPFFEQFRTLHLDPLETEECRRLWAVVSGDDVKDREVRPLQILTGGSPRLLVIIAQFARHRSLRHLMEDLVTLIDDHTEYFRSHLQAMPKVERLVYLAVIALWQPSSTSEIARRCRRDIRTVSAMLGRLVNRGAVTIEGSGKKRRYAATERLYSIYYILRRQRDEASVIQNLIRFMAAFYRTSELQRTIARFEQHHKKMNEPADVELRGQAELIKTRALIRKRDLHGATRLFRSAYAAFIPSDEMKMDQMLKLLIDFAASGDSRTLLDMLLEDDDKADMLAPFIVVLRKQLGEKVRAPAEVMEVADDIIEQIELRRTSDNRS